MKLFDSHCHLQDDRVISNVDALIKRAIDSGVQKMVCCGSTPADWDRVLELSSRFSCIIPSIGVHPWYVEGLSTTWFSQLKTILIDNPGVGIGEIGLDHLVKPRNDLNQLHVFCKHLELAVELHRPVSIHCRKAWGDLTKALGQYQKLPAGGLVHSFSGAPELVEIIQNAGLYLSFSGSITYDQNRKCRKSAIAVSCDRLLIETDTPDIVPASIHSQYNEPSYLVEIVNTLATLRETTPEKIAEITFTNGLKLFGK